MVEIVARMGEIRNAYRILKPENKKRRDRLQEVGDWTSIILK
jgi:hypothetical protein